MPDRITHRCGRCGEKAELEIVAHTEMTSDTLVEDILSGKVNVDEITKATRFVSVFCKCPRCNGATVIDYGVAKMTFANQGFFEDLEAGKDQVIRLPHSVSVIATFPSAANWRSIEGVPTAISELMEEIDTLMINKSRPSFILSAIGTAFEEVLKELGEDNGKLFEKIDRLADKGIITTQLKEWAHHLRYRRNKAVHDAQGTNEDVAELFRFLTTLIEVTIGLPSRIRRLDEGPKPE